MNEYEAREYAKGVKIVDDAEKAIARKVHRVIETPVFTFAELDERAKTRAREWLRECVSQDMDLTWMYDDFTTCASLLGIELRDKDIFWSGFSSQGDGASYAGSYAYKTGAAKAIRRHAPQDAELARIADALQKIQRTHFYALTASISAGSSHYAHEMTMCIDVEHVRGIEVADDVAEELRDTLRDFARWMYRQLEAQYDYELSDEAIDDSMRANEYTFTEDGKRFG